MKKYLLRSLLFVPGHNEKLLESASRSNADVLLLDLEDSVQPHANKILARERIREFVSSDRFIDFHVFPRINDRESGELLKDLSALTIPGVDGFMYPKATKGEDIYFIDKLLETIEYEKAIEIGTFKLIPLIETTGAVLNAQEICSASSRVIGIAFGCEDFITDLNGIHDPEGVSIYNPRAIIAMAARNHNVAPIDTVHIKVHDLEDLEKNLKLAKILGFEGMLVLHPKEIPLVHQHFSPTVMDVKEANEMLQLAEDAKKEGKGVAYMNNKFVGPPMVLTAKSILHKHKLILSQERNRNNNSRVN